MGVSVFACVFYGPELSESDTFWKTFITAFYMFFSPESIAEAVNNARETGKGGLFVVLVVLLLLAAIVFTVINMFISVVIIRYRFLRSQIQERSTAAFFIVRDQKPETLEDSEKAKTNADEGLTIGVRIRMNIYNIYTFFNNSIMSKEQYDNEIIKYLKQIKRNKKQMQKARVHAFQGSQYNKHWRNIKSLLIFFFFFLLGDVIIILMQLQVSTTYHHTSVKDLISLAQFRFDFQRFEGVSNNNIKIADNRYLLAEIDLSPLIHEWAERIMIPFVYNGDTLKILNQNYVFNKPYIRMSVIKYDYENNYGKDVDKTAINTTELQVNYTEPGTTNSPLFKGGFVLGFPDTEAEALSADYLSNTDYLSKNWGVVYLEFLYTAPNLPEHFYSLTYVKFSKSPSGYIDSKIDSKAVRHFYERGIDKFRLFLEIVWLMLNCFYIYTLIKKILHFYALEVEKYHEIQRNRNKKLPRRRRFKDNQDKEKQKLNKLDYFGIKFDENFKDQS